MLRPLFIASIEYFLTLLTLKKGKLFPYVAAAILFFLASYQLGEFIMFATDWDDAGVQLAYFSTTFLPALGILLIEKVAGKKYGFPLFFIIGGFFSFNFAVNPDIFAEYHRAGLFLRVDGFTSRIGTAWEIFYINTLLYGIILCAINIKTAATLKLRNRFAQILISYLSFFATSMAYIALVPDDAKIIASLMCAFALGAAIMLARMSITEKN